MAITLDGIREAALLACQVALEKKGEKVALLEFDGTSAVADYFVLVTSRSQTHAKALAQGLEATLDDFPLQRRGIEGYPHASWILLDYYGLVIHIFDSTERDYYNLERLWPNAKVQHFEEGMLHPSGI